MTPEIFTPESEPTRFQCRHIFADGRRCGSPALRGPEGRSEESQLFCYYHHTSRRPIQDAPTRRRRQSRFTLPNPEDRSAIQQGLAVVLQRIASNDIDPRRAGLLLYGLQIASLNLPKTNKSDPREEPAEIVSEVTHHPEHGLLAPPAEFVEPGANRPIGSAQRLLEELDALDAEYEAQQQRLPAPLDLQASADPKVYPESTTPAQTVRLTHPSKSHRPMISSPRPTNLLGLKVAPKDAPKVRSHELHITHHRNAVSPGRARAAGSASAQPRTPAQPDLHLRRSGRSR